VTSSTIDEIEAAYRPLEIASARAWWDAAVDANPATEAARAAADVAVSDFLADADRFTAVREARAHAADPLTRRRAELLEQAMLPQQVAADLRHRIVELQASVESTFATHRGEIDGQPVDDNEILEVLHTSDDVATRIAAWEASKTVGAAVAERVRELAHRRNDAARAVGFRDHFALALATQEMEEHRLLGTLAAVDDATAAPFAAWKAALDERLAARFGCAPEELRPWHYDDPFFQSPPAEAAVRLDDYFAGSDIVDLTLRTFTSLGLDVTAIMARSDLLPRDRKNQHAFCIDIDREGDVRVLCNVVPTERWMETMLHEFGHGIYFAEVDRGLPWGLRTMHALSTEGIAMLFGRLSREPEWLRDVAAVHATEVADLAERLHDAHRGALLTFARWVLVMTHFERGFYADPDGDHDTRWWDLVERYQLVRRPDGRRAPDWAAKIHVAAAPVYYQNYLYGELLASQLTETLRASAGGFVGRPDAGMLLLERVFRPGAALRWDALVEAATGEPLGAAAFAAELARA
jgi:peptidyl-dipeptidase A